ncbi:hypothetical protein BC835DRAFT_668168 [Cytidiella melzeri]|nr:hypothetical protein BC835DRAFT_668168 [Cytidiella melzeri]
MASFLDLPNEVVMYILAHTDVSDVLNLRKTCRRCFLLSHERPIWEAVLQAQSKHLPVPHFINSRSGRLDVRSGDLETLATSVHATATSWLRPHRPAQSLQPDVSPHHPGYTYSPRVRSIQDFHMLLDRWLVVVFQDSCYEIWDLYPLDENTGDPGLSRKGTWAWRTLKPACKLQEEIYGHCLSSAACIDPEDDTIILALSSQPVTTILGIDPTSSELEPKIIASIANGPFSTHIIRAIDPTSKVLVFSFSNTLHFWNWPTESYWQVEIEDVEDEVYTMVLSAHFLTPHHLICVQTHTVDLLTLEFLAEVSDTPVSKAKKTLQPDMLNFRGQRNVPLTQFPYPNVSMNMRGAMFSEPRTTYSGDTQTVTSTFLAYDVLRGLFHFAVEARLPHSPTSTPPLTTRGSPSLPLDMNVTLLASHYMAQFANVTSGQTHPARSGHTPGSRGFISTCALGSQGKRGVWVERHRSSMGRSVFGFATNNHWSESNAETGGNAVGPSGIQQNHIQGRCIHEVENSYDLRDDLTHCALSEITGTVVIGTRRGELRVLE